MDTTTSPQPVSAKTRRQRKFLLFLPVLVLPFLTFLLWTVGLVGTESAKAQQRQKLTKGLNMDLPDPNIKDGSMNKLSFYEQADKDSAKYKADKRNDPYYKDNLSPNETTLSQNPLSGANDQYSGKYDPAPASAYLAKQYTTPDQRVNEKLVALNKALKQQQQPEVTETLPAPYQKQTDEKSITTNDVDRLENMLKNVTEKTQGGDPEMQDINKVMENILDIQHPERVKERLRQESTLHKSAVLPVTIPVTDNITTLRGSGATDSTVLAKDTTIAFTARHNRFYTAGAALASEVEGNTIDAETAGFQTIVNGSTVELRLKQDVFIGGVLIPKGNALHGKASLSGERLLINISTIRYKSSILPVSLAVYDMDGMEGIYIPGAITRDVAKQSGDQAVQGMQISSLDPSIGAQVATAGIQAVKTLVGTKLRLIKVYVKSAYSVLLRDTNTQNK